MGCNGLFCAGQRLGQGQAAGALAGGKARRFAVHGQHWLGPDDAVAMARLVLPLLASYSDVWRAGGLVDNRCASTYTTAQSAARLLQASTTS